MILGKIVRKCWGSSEAKAVVVVSALLLVYMTGIACDAWRERAPARPGQLVESGDPEQHAWDLLMNFADQHARPSMDGQSYNYSVQYLPSRVAF